MPDQLPRSPLPAIDVNNLKQQLKFNKRSRQLLNRAVDKYGWQPTGISDNGDVINLISEKGQQLAQLVI